MTIVDIASIVLVDRTGRVLMQHRDYDTVNDPGLWSMPGGHAEPGEDIAAAAHRELLEETGLRAELTFVGIIERPKPDGVLVRFHVFTGTTGASQEDVVLGEGQAMVFLTREEIAERPVSVTAQRCLALIPPP